MHLWRRYCENICHTSFGIKLLDVRKHTVVKVKPSSLTSPGTEDILQAVQMSSLQHFHICWDSLWYVPYRTTVWKYTSTPVLVSQNLLAFEFRSMKGDSSDCLPVPPLPPSLPPFPIAKHEGKDRNETIFWPCSINVLVTESVEEKKILSFLQLQ